MAPTNAAEPLLGVSQSVTGFRWVDRCPPQLDRLTRSLAQQAGISDLTARLLAARGITPSEAAAFLEPSLRDLMPDPSTLQDMDVAAGLVADAIEAQAQIALFGDYDVDGATSTALLVRYLAAFGLTAHIHIPDRITEGYGPNCEAIEALAASGAELLITVDCGATSFDPLARAKDLGLTVVVIDHHQMTEQLPIADAVVNPNRLDDVSGQGHLAACGVVFLVLVAINRELRRRGIFASREEPDLRDLLSLVALGTVCDVVPLQGLNRAYVRRGLSQAASKPAVIGMTALARSARLRGPMEPFHLGYLLGPRINAGGRIGDAALGTRLLTTDDPGEAERLAEQLNRLNQERQAMEQVLLEAADASLVDLLAQEPTVLVVASEDYHPGLVGLIAGRLKERYQLPAFALSLNNDGTATGSGRSIGGVDLGAIVRAGVADGVLVKGGGHAMAAGLTVETAELEVFKSWLGEKTAEALAKADRSTEREVDGLITAGGLNTALLLELNRVGPFGASNPEPLFALPHHRIERAKVVGSSHIRATLVSGDGARCNAIAFRALGQPLGDALLAADKPLHVMGSLALDSYGGRDSVQVQIKDVATPIPMHDASLSS